MLKTKHMRPLGHLIIFVTLLFPISSYSQTRVLIGSLGINQYSNWYENNSSRYRTFSEDKSGALALNFAFLRAEGMKRRGLELSILRRSLFVNTFSGGLGGGGSNKIDMNLTQVNLAGFVGTRITKTLPLYLDFGGYIGIPLVRKVEDNYRISVMPPFDMNNGSGTNNDPSEYFSAIEVGVIVKTGFQFKLTDRMAFSTAFRLHCGFGGKKEFNNVAFDQVAMLGVGYILEKRE